MNRIRVVGDSWALGNNPTQWPRRVEQKLERENYALQVDAFGGTGFDVWGPFGLGWNESRPSLHVKPDLTIICCGVNDLYRSAAPWQCAMVLDRLFENNFNNQYMICRMGTHSSMLPEIQAEIRTMNYQYEQVVAESSNAVLGFDPEKLLTDAHYDLTFGPHPSALGHAVLAVDIEARIRAFFD